MRSNPLEHALDCFAKAYYLLNINVLLRSCVNIGAVVCHELLKGPITFFATKRYVSANPLTTSQHRRWDVYADVWQL